jgi:16S rRNA (guanine966-N2)-methyltransferase
LRRDRTRFYSDRSQGYAVASKSGKNGREARPRAGTAPQESTGTGYVRIIGGEWRGRRLRIPPVADLRPTPDRLRETLFNWLQGAIPGARALDLFAGSGALGMEALSRGAARATLVERDPIAARSIAASLATLAVASDRAEVLTRDVFAFLNAPPVGGAYDLVFLDPPYRAGRLPELCTLLAQGGWLRPGAWVYLECPAGAVPVTLPGGWLRWREARAGAASATLARLPAPPAAATTTSVITAETSA